MNRPKGTLQLEPYNVTASTFQEMVVGKDGVLDVCQVKMPWIRSEIGQVQFILNLDNNDEEIEQDSDSDDKDLKEQMFEEHAEEEKFPGFTQSQIIPDLSEQKSLDGFGDRYSFLMDNAKPHVGYKNLIQLNQHCALNNFRIRFDLQSPQSPDFNILDLSIFHSD